MTSRECPDPTACVVPGPGTVDMRLVRTTRLAKGTVFHTAFRRRYWPAVFNPSSVSEVRFSPLRSSGGIVPVLYGASTITTALLETAFHEVHAGGRRIISEAVDLAPRGLATLQLPYSMPFIDIRDAALENLGIARYRLVASSPAHYPCTREWAQRFYDRGKVGSANPVGLIWHSRTAEIAAEDSPLLSDLLPGRSSEVFVLFGDRVPTDVATYAGVVRHDDLNQPAARRLVDSVAHELRATVVPSP